MMNKLILLLVVLLPFAEANWFRYGQITWERVMNATTANKFVVRFSFKLGINDVNNNQALGNEYDFKGLKFKFGDGTNSSLKGPIVDYHAASTIYGQQWFIMNPVIEHEYASAGPFYGMVESEPFARDSTLEYNDLNTFRLRCQVDLSNGNNFSPVITEPFQQNFYWNQTDVRFVGYDPDGDPVTFRLATLYEMGDDLNPALLGPTAQISRQPPELTVGFTNGTISWVKARDLPIGKYQLQVMFMDGKGAEVPVDFILINKPSLNSRPTIGGGNTPVVPYENFLVNQPITYEIQACDATDSIMEIYSTMDPTFMKAVGTLVTVPTSGQFCSYQKFNFTPPTTAPGRYCVFAIDAVGSVSQIYCYSFDISAAPRIDDLWQAPTKAFKDNMLEAWFNGYYINALDRVAIILATESCAALASSAGAQVEAIFNPVSRVALGPTLNYNRSTINLKAEQLGWNKWCYKLNAGTAYGNELPWSEIPGAVPFEIIDYGVRRISALPGCPLYDKAFRYVLQGVDLQRFDRVKFLTPSRPPHWISTINCEGLTDSDGTAIKDFGVLDGLSPGFVIGAERVEFPWKVTQNDVGQYFCYKPFGKPWRMMDYLKTFADTGVWSMLSSTSLGQGQAQVVLNGIGLDINDKFAVYPYSADEDCSQMLLPGSTAATVFGAGNPLNTTHATFTVSGATYPGINLVTLCYEHKGKACRIRDINLKDSPYGYKGIPDALSTTSLYPFTDYEPFQAHVNESMIYEFTGYVPYGYIINDPCVTTPEMVKDCTTCKGMQVKVAEHGSCVGTAKGGEPRYFDKDRRVIFRLEETGLFRFCILHRIDWEPVSRGVEIIARPPPQSNEAFYKFVNCHAYLEEYAPTGTCGCFLSGYPGAPVDVPTTHPVSAALSSSLNFNQGCCASPAAARVQVGVDKLGGVDRPWGYCTHTPVLIPNPYPPYENPAAQVMPHGH
uniref:Uncharacterized protein n=1 Tax=Eutreptiella gymnastica TaxID=73025 RepID=A0A7S1HSZ2_9EUGL|mmetsp:Transcript_10370/g.18277  ORF Transcript_10370/g.18277 Transcript_10370/m.18277 type:complete len:951 (+) Transcript_10370:84-2936(+)